MLCRGRNNHGGIEFRPETRYCWLMVLLRECVHSFSCHTSQKAHYSIVAIFWATDAPPRLMRTRWFWSAIFWRILVPTFTTTRVGDFVQVEVGTNIKGYSRQTVRSRIKIGGKCLPPTSAELCSKRVGAG